ncbi:hypothetical protein ACFL4D_02165 [Candidatus Margulisiibacteriota bacterium]
MFIRITHIATGIATVSQNKAGVEVLGMHEYIIQYFVLEVRVVILKIACHSHESGRSALWVNLGEVRGTAALTSTQLTKHNILTLLINICSYENNSFTVTLKINGFSEKLRPH